MKIKKVIRKTKKTKAKTIQKAKGKGQNININIDQSRKGENQGPQRVPPQIITTSTPQFIPQYMPMFNQPAYLPNPFETAVRNTQRPIINEPTNELEKPKPKAPEPENKDIIEVPQQLPKPKAPEPENKDIIEVPQPKPKAPEPENPFQKAIKNTQRPPIGQEEPIINEPVELQIESEGDRIRAQFRRQRERERERRQREKQEGDREITPLEEQAKQEAPTISKVLKEPQPIPPIPEKREITPIEEQAKQEAPTISKVLNEPPPIPPVPERFRKAKEEEELEVIDIDPEELELIKQATANYRAVEIPQNEEVVDKIAYLESIKGNYPLLSDEARAQNIPTHRSGKKGAGQKSKLELYQDLSDKFNAKL